MEKRILIFEDDEKYLEMLQQIVEDTIEDNRLNLRISFERSPNYCAAKTRIEELARQGTIGDYALILIDLKLPFAADRPEEGMDNEFLGFELTRLLRERFGDKAQYVPISSLVDTVLGLDPKLTNIDKDDIGKTLDKTDIENLAAEIIRMLTPKKPA
jgi:CheY-like chemotaxis protein